MKKATEEQPDEMRAEYDFSLVRDPGRQDAGVAAGWKPALRGRRSALRAFVRTREGGCQHHRPGACVGGGGAVA